MPDFIEPLIGIPLAATLWAAWWFVERGVRRTANHEIRRQP